MKIFLEKNNLSFKETIIQNKPFKKKVPIYSFIYKKEKKELKNKNINCKNYFKKNISVYNDFYKDQIKKFTHKHSRIRIYIFGNNFLSELAYEYLKTKKKKKLILIRSFSADLYKKSDLLKECLDINSYNSSIFLICENKKDNIIKNSLINRFHVNLNNSVYILDKNFNFRTDSFRFENKIYLKKKINFNKI